MRILIEIDVEEVDVKRVRLDRVAFATLLDEDREFVADVTVHGAHEFQTLSAEALKRLRD